MSQDVGEVAFEMSAVGGRDEGSDLGRRACVWATSQCQPSRPFPGFAEIHVGEGVVGGNRVCMFEHTTCEVGVQIERQYHQTLETEIGTHLLQDVAFGVVFTDGAGRPVQVQDQDIERGGGPQAGK